MASTQTLAVDLSKEQAFGFFDECITTACMDPQCLWKYSRGKPSDWKKTVVWSEVKVHRLAISAIFDATIGRQLKHKIFVEQLLQWMQNRKIQWPFSDVELAVYNLRAMMAHLRDVRRSAKKPPKGFEIMNSVLDKIVIDGSDGIVRHTATAEENLKIVEAPKKHVELVRVSSDESASSSDLKLPTADADIDLDDLECRLFRTPRTLKRSATELPTMSTEKRSKVVDADELMAMLEKAKTTVPPTPSEVNSQNRKTATAMKKPAAAMKKPAAAPVNAAAPSHATATTNLEAGVGPRQQVRPSGHKWLMLR